MSTLSKSPQIGSNRLSLTRKPRLITSSYRITYKKRLKRPSVQLSRSLFTTQRPNLSRVCVKLSLKSSRFCCQSENPNLCQNPKIRCMNSNFLISLKPSRSLDLGHQHLLTRIRDSREIGMTHHFMNSLSKSIQEN